MTTSTSTMSSSSSRRKHLRNSPGTIIPGPRLSLSAPLYYKSSNHRLQRQHDTDEPFFLLVLKVGLTLAALSTVTFCLYSYQTLLAPSVSSSVGSSQSQLHQMPQLTPPRKNKRPMHMKLSTKTKTESSSSSLRAPFPTFTLGPDAAHDAFAVAAKYNLTNLTGTSSTDNDNDNDNTMSLIQEQSQLAFVQHAADMRKEFVYRYGASEIPAS